MSVNESGRKGMRIPPQAKETACVKALREEGMELKEEDRCSTKGSVGGEIAKEVIRAF